VDDAALFLENRLNQFSSKAVALYGFVGLPGAVAGGVRESAAVYGFHYLDGRGVFGLARSHGIGVQGDGGDAGVKGVSYLGPGVWGTTDASFEDENAVGIRAGTAFPSQTALDVRGTSTFSERATFNGVETAISAVSAGAVGAIVGSNAGTGPALVGTSGSETSPAASLENSGGGPALAGISTGATSAAATFENVGAGDGVVVASKGATAAGVRATNSGGGYGIVGSGSGARGDGVRGTNTAGGHGVVGMASGAKTAVLGRNTGLGHGVLGHNSAVKAAVAGRNTGKGDGVRGQSTEGRGGSFAGKAAALRLVPSAAPDHPAEGLAGDLFVDSTRRLWFCKRGGKNSLWVELA
jgi:hypothetical protein